MLSNFSKVKQFLDLFNRYGPIQELDLFYQEQNAVFSQLQSKRHTLLWSNLLSCFMSYSQKTGSQT